MRWSRSENAATLKGKVIRHKTGGPDPFQGDAVLTKAQDDTHLDQLADTLSTRETIVVMLTSQSCHWCKKYLRTFKAVATQNNSSVKFVLADHDLCGKFDRDVHDIVSATDGGFGHPVTVTVKSGRNIELMFVGKRDAEDLVEELQHTAGISLGTSVVANRRRPMQADGVYKAGRCSQKDLRDEKIARKKWIVLEARQQRPDGSCFDTYTTEVLTTEALETSRSHDVDHVLECQISNSVWCSVTDYNDGPSKSTRHSKTMKETEAWSEIYTALNSPDNLVVTTHEVNEHPLPRAALLLILALQAKFGVPLTPGCSSACRG